jgi:hypothetical protein
MDRQRTSSRWQGSEVAFGPVGRIVATLLVLIPILFAIFVNVFFLIAAAIWAFFVLPRAMRDIWRRTSTSPAQPPIIIPPEPGPIPPGESINDRTPPARW